MVKNKTGRWHPSQENDELIFSVCDHFLSQLGESCSDGDSMNTERERKGAAAAVAEWLKKKYGRTDLTREKIYPLFWEALRRNFIRLQPPVENILQKKLMEHFHLEDYSGQISIVNVKGTSASLSVTSVAADQIIALIDQVAEEKRKQAVLEGKDPNNIQVHLGMGAGYASMLVAKRLANRSNFGEMPPSLVLHAISSGGFFIDEPHKVPTTYFSYFHETQVNVQYVALFSETVIHKDEYEKIKSNPGLRRCFERKNEIDIIVTSLADAEHEHGLLGQYLSYLMTEGLIQDDVIHRMKEVGWVGDVQFRPYSKEGPLKEVCPVRAVALFELEEMVQFARQQGKHIVLIGGPCGECGSLKTKALRPLLQNENLRLWTHLITDVQTARELLTDEKT